MADIEAPIRPPATSTGRPLVELLSALAARGYDFVTPTPSTCRRMAEQPAPARPGLRDIFGWSRPFTEPDLDGGLMDLLRAADLLEDLGGRYRSRVRVSAVHGRLFLHSAFPTNTAEAVFLGPDSYRFADLVAAELRQGPAVSSILDIGAGAGVGGIVADRYAPGAAITLSDVNPHALTLAAANAEHARVGARLVRACGLEGTTGDFDLIIANPPYIAGASGRIYKDGGDLHGARLSLDWTRQGLARLAPGGRMILYTGSAILSGGRDQLRERLEDLTAGGGFSLRYRELDPDIFSSELRRAAYADVERLAAVGAVVTSVTPRR